MTAFQKALESAKDTYAGCHWVYTELISTESKKHINISLMYLLLAIFSLMTVPYTIKQILDAVAAGDQAGAEWGIYKTVLSGIAGATFGAMHDHYRERSWNSNYYNVCVRLVHKLYRRTLEEIIGENSEIGAEQIESLKDKVQNILYLFLFEMSVVLVTILNANVYMFALDANAALIMLALTGLNIVWFFYFNSKIDDKMEPIDKALRKAHRRMIEKLNLATSVKPAGVEKKIEKQIGDEIRGPLAADLQIWAYWFLYVEYTRRIINAIVPGIVLWYGVFFAHWGVGTISAMATWAFMISREYGFIGHLMRHLTSQVARIKAARKALSIPPKFDYDVGIVYERGLESISFQNVHLDFEGVPVLRDVSFEIPKGARVALIGESGSGKSSIAGLLMRKLDPSSGTISVNGVSLKDYNLSSVLRHVGTILQRPEMVSGDVRENILLATHEEDMCSVDNNSLWRVLDAISPALRQRFNSKGLETLVGKQGMQLSGGEQQRICIARALIKNPEMLIVDEATASLDSKNQAMVQEGIDTALHSDDVSALVIAHRFSTLENCDTFIVLRKLDACEDGESQIEAICSSLSELHEQSPTFRELASHEGFQF